MKKNHFAFICLTGLLTLSIFSAVLFSCKKTENNMSSSTQIIYKRANLKESLNPSIFADHITMVERIPFTSSELDSLKANTTWIYLYATSGSLLDTGHISRASYDYNQMKVFSIPFDEGSGTEHLIIYSLNNKFLFAKSRLQAVNDTLREFKLLSLGNDIYYQFQINQENKIGNFSIENTIPFADTFSPTQNTVNTATIPCNQQGLPFGQCILCAINECAQSWICAVVCGVEFQLCIVGWGLGCLQGVIFYN